MDPTSPHTQTDIHSWAKRFCTAWKYSVMQQNNPECVQSGIDYKEQYSLSGTFISQLRNWERNLSPADQEERMVSAPVIMSFKRELSHFFQTHNSRPQNWAQDKINSCDFPGKCHVCCEVSVFLLWDGSHLNSSRRIRASMFTCQATESERKKTDGGRDRTTEKSLLARLTFLGGEFITIYSNMIRSWNCKLWKSAGRFSHVDCYCSVWQYNLVIVAAKPTEWCATDLNRGGDRHR